MRWRLALAALLLLTGASFRIPLHRWPNVLERWPSLTSLCAGQNGVYGFGACSTGGAAGISVVVDTTAWVSPGAGAFDLTHCTDGSGATACNFAEAVCGSNRTVTFSVSGGIIIPNVANGDGSNNSYFELADCPASTLPIKNLTIDGSTAPGAGVYLDDRSFIIDGPAGGGVAENVVVRHMRHRGSSDQGVSLSTGIAGSGCVGCVFDHISGVYAATYGFLLGNNMFGHENEKNRNVTLSKSLFAYSHMLHEFQGASAADTYINAGKCSVATTRDCCLDGDNIAPLYAGECPGTETCEGESDFCQFRNRPGKVFSLNGSSVSTNAGATCNNDWDAAYGLCSAYCDGPGAHLNKRAGLQTEHGGIKRSLSTTQGLCEGGPTVGASCTLDSHCGGGGGTCRNECEQLANANYAIGPWLFQGMDNFGVFVGGNLSNFSMYRNLMLGFRWRAPNLSIDTCTGNTCAIASSMSQSGSYDIAQNWAYGGRFMADLWSEYSTRQATVTFTHNAHEHNAATRNLFSDFHTDPYIQLNASSGAFVGPGHNPNTGPGTKYYFKDNRDTWHSVGGEACYRGTGCGADDAFSWSCANTDIGCRNIAGSDNFSNSGYYGSRNPVGSVPAYPGTFAALKPLVASEAGATLPCRDAVDDYAAETVTAGVALRVLHHRDEIGGPQQDMSVCPSAANFTTSLTAQSKTGVSAVAAASGAGIETTTATVSTTENRMLKMHCGIQSAGAVKARVRDPRCSGGTVTLDFDVGEGGTSLANGCYPFSYWLSIGSWANRAIGSIEVDVGGGNCAVPPDVVTVIAPNGGESIPQNSTYNISWSHEGLTSVDIAYSSTGCGGSFTNIVLGTPSDGSYLWTTPFPIGSNYCVRVRDIDGTPSDTSNAVFTITDVTTPAVSAVNAISIGTTSATAVWTTDEVSDSFVEWGTTLSYGTSTSNASDVLSHSLGITGLSSSTLYNYRVRSCDPYDNCTTSDNNTFTTLASGGGGGPVCVHGPYTSATSLSTINGIINGAADGAVVCLRRGNTWTGSLSFTASHPDASRVTICGSDDTQCDPCPSGKSCTTAAGASPIIQNNGTVLFFSNSDGYTIKDIHFRNTGSPSDGAQAIANWNRGNNRDITFDGGRFEGFPQLLTACVHASAPSCAGAGVAGAPTNIKFGTCAHPLEFGNAYYSQEQHMFFGTLDGATISMDIHDWGITTNVQGRGHMWDFTAWTSSDQGGRDIVFECNNWQIDTGVAQGLGSWIKAAYGAPAAGAPDMTIRNNKFHDIATATTSVANSILINFEEHDATAIAYKWYGAEIHHNEIFMRRSTGKLFNTRMGVGIKIYSNVIGLFGSSFPALNQQGRIFEVNPPHSCCGGPQPDGFEAYNNTIFSDGPRRNEEFSVNAGTGHKVYNNIIVNPTTPGYDGNAEAADVFNTNDCSRFTTIGPNFVYTPADSTPTITACGGATWLPGAPWNTAPGFIDSIPDRFEPQDFDITGGSAAATGCTGTPPSADIDGVSFVAGNCGAFSENE